MTSGWSALILCLIVGPRLGFGKEKMAPHSMVLCMVGTGMLWVGWYGFNAGSGELRAVGITGRFAPLLFVHCLIGLGHQLFDGVTIAAGTTIHLLSESAGTDPRVFTDNFDIAAERERHYGFGGGVHHCLGHLVARSDMTIAFRGLSQRIEAPKPDGVSEWLADSGNTGPITLPIRFERPLES